MGRKKNKAKKNNSANIKNKQEKIDNTNYLFIKKPWTIRLRNYFITGLIALVPIVATVYATYWAGSLIDSIPSVIIPSDTLASRFFSLYAPPGIGILVVLTVVTFVGLLTSNFIGKSLLNFSESILDRLPLIRIVYKTLKQISDSIFNDHSSFDRAILVQYPIEGTWCIAFVTGNGKGEINYRLNENSDDKLLSVFVPTTPNPTSGFLLFVKEKDTLPLEMKVEDAVQTIISAGLISPPWENDKNGEIQPKALPIPESVIKNTK